MLGKLAMQHTIAILAGSTGHLRKGIVKVGDQSRTPGAIK
jgi:hypothetical protein